MASIKKSQQAIRDDGFILNYDDDTLKYIQKPIGKALQRGRPRKPEEEKGKPSDRIVCKLCHREFVRSNRSHHDKTERHKLYARVNQKLAKLVLD